MFTRSHLSTFDLSRHNHMTIWQSNMAYGFKKLLLTLLYFEGNLFFQFRLRIHNFDWFQFSGVSGIILNLLGFVGVYTTTFFMIFSSFVYAYYIVKERNIIAADVEKELEELKDTPKVIEGGIYIIEHFFHTVRVFLTERPSNKRLRLMAAVLLTMIVSGPLKGIIWKTLQILKRKIDVFCQNCFMLKLMLLWKHCLFLWTHFYGKIKWFRLLGETTFRNWIKVGCIIFD